MRILVLNAGSSSDKSCLYECREDTLEATPPKPLWNAHIDWSAHEGKLRVQTSQGQWEYILDVGDRTQGVVKMLHTLVEGESAVLKGLEEIDAVGHRVVHGGATYAQAVRITPEVKEVISDLIPLAPAHNPAHLAGISTIETLLPDVPQIAVFDTAFHNTIPEEASVYAIPYEWKEKGIRRYGFHGTSHKYCSQRAVTILGKSVEKMITCHLGNGCSLTAIRDGKSIDTTMGFTPLEGLMMGSRSGSIDPAILLYMITEHGLTPEELNTMLNQESGLKGVSGISADLRAIVSAVDEGNTRAKLALDMYIYHIKTGIGAMVASLNGLEVLVFTAGVGENSSVVREGICEGLSFLGLHLDKEKNALSPRDKDVATDKSPIRVLVIHTEEDWAIAQECWHYLKMR